MYQLLLNAEETFWLSDGEIHPNDAETDAGLFQTVGNPWLLLASEYRDMNDTHNWLHWDGTLARTALGMLFRSWKNGRGIRQNAKPHVWRLDHKAMQRQLGWCCDCGGSV